MEPLIVCRNLVKIYKVADLEVVALQGLDLVVRPGELLGIVGASGSGKSTLLNILGGLDRPSAGRVTVNGRDLLKLPDRELDVYRRHEVGFVWQQSARNLIPYLTARENVELPMTVAGTSFRKKRAWSQELLEMVGLWDQRRHRLAQLSGGQQQRVAIALALANKPKLLLGDEPTGEVDSTTAREIMTMFQRMSEQHGLTTIIVTHDPQVARVANRVVTIRDGRTSSESVRRIADVEAALAHDATADGGRGGVATQPPVMDEYTVVDAAGRLQIPPDLREKTGIGGRVTLEAVEDGIFIRPAASAAEAATAAGALTPDEAPKARPRGLRRWLRRDT